MKHREHHLFISEELYFHPTSGKDKGNTSGKSGLEGNLGNLFIEIEGKKS